VPGVTKCIWNPVSNVQWNGLLFDFERFGIAVLDHRIEHTIEKASYLLNNWPAVTFREVSQFLGQLNSMHPVLKGLSTLRLKYLQTFVNLRHFQNMSWDRKIVTDVPALFEKAKEEILFWNENLVGLNFRPVPLISLCSACQREKV
jgi:hypothetical protein